MHNKLKRYLLLVSNNSNLRMLAARILVLIAAVMDFTAAQEVTNAT